MLMRLLVLGVLVLVMTSCGQRHHGHDTTAQRHYGQRAYPAADPPPYDDVRRHSLPRMNSARIEQGAENATRTFTEGVTAIAEGLEQGVVQGAKDGARDVQTQIRHRRKHHFSYTYEEVPHEQDRASRDY